MLPSDIARLVLAYLHEEGLTTTYHAFLTESPHLDEIRRNPSATILRPSTKSLVATLEEYEDIKYAEKGRTTSDKVLTGLWKKFDSVIGQIKYKYQPSGNSAENQSIRSKHNLMILRSQQIKTKGSVSVQPKIKGSLVVPYQTTTPVIIPNTTTSPEMGNQKEAQAIITPMCAPVARVQLPLTESLEVSSTVALTMGLTSTVFTSTSLPSAMMTSPVQALPVIGSRNYGDNEDGVCGGMVTRQRRDSGSSINSATSDLSDFQNLSPYKRQLAKQGSGVFKSPKRKSSAPKRKPVKNADQQKKAELPAPIPTGEMDLDELLKDIPVVLEELLGSRELQQRLAGNINKSRPETSKKKELGVPASPQDPSVGQSLSIDDILNSQMSEDTVTEIIQNTSSDPAFEALFSLFNVDKDQYAEEQRAEIAARNKDGDAASSNTFAEPMDISNAQSQPHTSTDATNKTTTTPTSIPSMVIYGISPSESDSKPSNAVSQSHSTPLTVTPVLNINEDSQMAMEPIVLPSLDGSDPQIMSPVAVTSKKSPIPKQQASPIPKQQQALPIQQQASVARSNVVSSFSTVSNDSHSQSSFNFMSRSGQCMVPPKKRQRPITLDDENLCTFGTDKITPTSVVKSPNVKSFSFAQHLGLNQGSGMTGKTTGIVSPVSKTEHIKTQNQDDVISKKSELQANQQQSEGCTIEDINQIIKAKRDLFNREKLSPEKDRSSPSKLEKSPQRKPVVQARRMSKRKTRSPERFSPCITSKNKQRVEPLEKEKPSSSRNAAQNKDDDAKSSNSSKTKVGKSRNKTPKKTQETSECESPLRKSTTTPKKDESICSNQKSSMHSSKSKPLSVDTSQNLVHDAESFMAVLNMSPTGKSSANRENLRNSSSQESLSGKKQTGTTPRLKDSNVIESNEPSVETKHQNTSRSRRKQNLTPHKSLQSIADSPKKSSYVSPRKNSTDIQDGIDLDSEPATPQMQIVSQPNTPQAVLSPEPMTPQFVQTDVELSNIDENTVDTITSTDSQVSIIDLVSSEAEQSQDGNLPSANDSSFLPSQTNLKDKPQEIDNNESTSKTIVVDTMQTTENTGSGAHTKQSELSDMQTSIQNETSKEDISGHQSQGIHDEKDSDAQHRLVPDANKSASKSKLTSISAGATEEPMDIDDLSQSPRIDHDQVVGSDEPGPVKSTTYAADHKTPKKQVQKDDVTPAKQILNWEITPKQTVNQCDMPDKEGKTDDSMQKKQILKDDVTPAKQVLTSEVTPKKKTVMPQAKQNHATPAESEKDCSVKQIQSQKTASNKQKKPSAKQAGIKIKQGEQAQTKDTQANQGEQAAMKSNPDIHAKQVKNTTTSSVKHVNNKADEVTELDQEATHEKQTQSKNGEKLPATNKGKLKQAASKVKETQEKGNIQSKESSHEKQTRSKKSEKLPATNKGQPKQAASKVQGTQEKVLIKISDKLPDTNKGQPKQAASKVQRTIQSKETRNERAAKTQVEKQDGHVEEKKSYTSDAGRVATEIMNKNKDVAAVKQNQIEIRTDQNDLADKNQEKALQKLDESKVQDQAPCKDSVPATPGRISSNQSENFVTVVPCNIIGSDTAILQAPIPVPQVKTPGKDQQVQMSQDVENTIKPMQALCKVISAGRQVSDVTVTSASSPMQTIDPKAIGMALSQSQIVATPPGRKVRTIYPKGGLSSDSVGAAIMSSGLASTIVTSTPVTTRLLPLNNSEIKQTPVNHQSSKTTEMPKITPEGSSQTIRPISGKRSGSSSKSANTRPPLRRISSTGKDLIVRTLDVDGNVTETTPKVQAPPRINKNNKSGSRCSRGSYVVRNLDCHIEQEAEKDTIESEHFTGVKKTSRPFNFKLKSPDLLFDQPSKSPIKLSRSQSPKKVKSLILNRSSSAMVSPEANAEKPTFVTPHKTPRKTPRKQDLRAAASKDFEATVDLAAEVLASCSPRKTPIKQRTPKSGDLTETSRLAEAIIRMARSPMSRFTAIQSASILRNVGNSPRRNLMAEQDRDRTKHRSGGTEGPSPRKHIRGRPRLKDRARPLNLSQHEQILNGVSGTTVDHASGSNPSSMQERRIPEVNGDVNETEKPSGAAAGSPGQESESGLNAKSKKQGKGKKRPREESVTEQLEMKKSKKSKKKSRRSFPTNMDVDKFLSQLHYPQ